MSPDQIFIPDWPDLPDCVGALSTLRSGGVSPVPYDDANGAGGFNLADHVGDDKAHVAQNREILEGYLPSQPVWLTQVHGNKVINLDQQSLDLTGDGCVASKQGIVCAIMTADCLPLLFFAIFEARLLVQRTLGGAGWWAG